MIGRLHASFPFIDVLLSLSALIVIYVLLPLVYTCALSKDILLQGKMFVSQNWICFYSNIFGYETKVCTCIYEVCYWYGVVQL